MVQARERLPSFKPDAISFRRRIGIPSSPVSPLRMAGCCEFSSEFLRIQLPLSQGLAMGGSLPGRNGSAKVAWSGVERP